MQNSSTKEVYNSCTAIKDSVTTAIVYFDVVNGNGLLTAKVEDKQIKSGDTVALGSMVEFTAIPNMYYVVKEWRLNDNVVLDNNYNIFRTEAFGETKVTVEFLSENGINVNNLTCVELYPNPVTHELYLKNIEFVKSVTITNVMGQVIIREMLTGKSSAILTIQGLPSGLFFVTLTNAEGLEITKKMVKK